MKTMANDIATNPEELVEKSNVFVEYVKGLIPGALDFAVDVLIALLIYIIGVKLISIIRKMIQRMMERSHLDAGVKSFLDSLTKFALYFLLIVFIATRFGATTASVTALVGSAGLAVGLALQGSLANFAGGVLILVMKPFELGDYIITDSGEGTVMQIQICYTRLLTVDNKMVVIPNGKLSDGVITNVTKMEKRRVDFTYSIAYGEDIKKAKGVIEEIFNADEARIAEDPIEVFVDSLRESDVVLGARIWVKTEDYWTTKFRLQEQILEAFSREGIVIPFPQMEITLHNK
ncbi:MAG: mechanosensitive ion channel [Lachnospiraceae bacterium]|jgi:small conductance mechanosensitive channel|nr:mechanosensitive ion channel [Lachnospiraceae bacterium]